jgi:hypothetical protein
MGITPIQSLTSHIYTILYTVYPSPASFSITMGLSQANLALQASKLGLSG